MTPLTCQRCEQPVPAAVPIGWLTLGPEGHAQTTVSPRQRIEYDATVIPAFFDCK